MKTKLAKNLVLLLICGAFIGFNWILLFEAYRYTTVATATVCYYLAPVFAILVAPLVGKGKLTPVRTVCALVALLGMIPLSGVLGGEIRGAKGILCGVVTVPVGVLAGGLVAGGLVAGGV